MGEKAAEWGFEYSRREEGMLGLGSCWTQCRVVCVRCTALQSCWRRGVVREGGGEGGRVGI